MIDILTYFANCLFCKLRIKKAYIISKTCNTHNELNYGSTYRKLNSCTLEPNMVFYSSIYLSDIPQICFVNFLILNLVQIGKKTGQLFITEYAISKRIMNFYGY